jgi:short-subunit dehydrogenase
MQLTNYFNNKVVAVTGGTDGIGKALVEALLLLGAKVATCGRNHDKMHNLMVSQIGKPLHTLIVDVSNTGEAKRFIDTTIETFGKIDILINNAGISMHSLFKDVELEVIEKVMQINFMGSVACTKYALESILQQKGDIVTVSSIAGYRGLPGRTGYSASKFAVNGWMESLRTELLKTGVNVLTVCPGFTTSNIRNVALNAHGSSQGEGKMDENAMMSSEECAQHILKAIAKRKRKLVLTFTGKRTIFLNKFFPKLADSMVYKFFYKDGQLVK